MSPVLTIVYNIVGKDFQEEYIYFTQNRHNDYTLLPVKNTRSVITLL